MSHNRHNTVDQLAFPVRCGDTPEFSPYKTLPQSIVSGLYQKIKYSRFAYSGQVQEDVKEVDQRQRLVFGQSYKYTDNSQLTSDLKDHQEMMGQIKSKKKEIEQVYSELKNMEKNTNDHGSNYHRDREVDYQQVNIKKEEKHRDGLVDEMDKENLKVNFNI